jgi:anaerobic glycerol-3-phosphate dehydrogenase
MTPIFGLLWQQLQQKDISSGQDAIEQLAMQLGINADTSFHHHAQQALQELFEWGAILGAHNERT